MKLFLILASILILSVVGVIEVQESFATEPRSPDGGTTLEISSMPKLNEEFELTISLFPFNYNGNWEKDSTEKNPVGFTVTLPKNFQIIDKDFSKGGQYGHHLPDDYQTYSTTRDVSYPYQTTVKIIPTEPGLWQIMAEGGYYFPAKIFVTLTENYSFISDKPNSILKRETCNQDNEMSYDKITVMDLETNLMTKNIKNDFMKEHSGAYWNILVNPITDLSYVYASNSANIEVIDVNSGETVKNLQSSSRLFDHVLNPKTNLIYFTNEDSKIMVINGSNNSVVSSIDYILNEDGNLAKSMAINSKTNTMYVADEYTDIVYIIDLDTNKVLEIIHAGSNFGMGNLADIEVNEVTNTIYVINWNTYILYVIDGFTNSVIESIPVDKGTYDIEVNEVSNEIYVYAGSTQKLYVIDGKNHSIINTMKLYNSSYHIKFDTMEFDQTTNSLYIPNIDSSLIVINVDSFDFDIIYNCSIVSDLSIHSEKDLLYVTDRTADNTVIITFPEPLDFTQPWIEDLNYPRTEYLLDENVNFRMHNISGVDVNLDLIIKNIDNNKVVFTFSEFETLFEFDGDINISWNQLDLDNKPVISGNYALLIKGTDNENNTYEAHKLFSIIANIELDELQLLHNTMFSYFNTNDDVLSPQKQMSNGISSEDITCKKGLKSISKISGDVACVKPSTAEKLIKRGWARS